MKGYFFYLTISILFLCFSCDTGEEISELPLQIYIKLLSQNGDGVRCEVKPVGYDGNTLSGAIVTVVNPAKKTMELNYDGGSYKGIFEIPLSGEYRIFVKAISDGKIRKIERTVFHTAITEKPKIETLADALGTSALSGGNLNSLSNITIGWKSVESTIYNVVIMSDYLPIYSINTGEAVCMIPEKTLSPGKNYSVSVTAQYLQGDPFLFDQDFASQSIYSGSSVFFRTAE